MPPLWAISIDLSKPFAADVYRDVVNHFDKVRPRSRETTPSDGPPHKFHMSPPLGDNPNVPQSINLGLPGPSRELSSNRSTSNTGSNKSPGSHRSDAQRSQHDSVLHTFGLQ